MSKCAHGLEASQCLICQTLGTAPSPQVATEGPPRGRRFGHGDRTPQTARPDIVFSPNAPPQRRTRSLGFHVGLLIVAVLAVGLVVWLVAGIVLALLHVAELVLVALAAGWAGYRIGKHRGAKQSR